MSSSRRQLYKFTKWQKRPLCLQIAVLLLYRDGKAMSTVGDYTPLDLAPKNVVNNFSVQEDLKKNYTVKQKKLQGNVVTGLEVMALN